MPVAAWELVSSGVVCRLTWDGGWRRGHGFFQQDIERGEICGRTKEKISGREEKNHCRKK